MVLEFLRRNKRVSFLLLLIRIYLGVIWITHGWDKISSKTFDATGFLKEAVTKAEGADAIVQGWWVLVIQLVFLPNVEILNYLVPLGELFVGMGLLAGFFTLRALQFGIMMNFIYLLCGSVDVNPQMILLSLLLFNARDNAGRVGMDGWIFGSIKKRMHKPAPPAGAGVKPPM